MISVCFRVILNDYNVYSEFVSNSVEFLEISRNRLAALKVRQAAHATKLVCPVFTGFGYFYDVGRLG